MAEVSSVWVEKTAKQTSLPCLFLMIFGVIGLLNSKLKEASCELGFVIPGERGLPKSFKAAVTCGWMATDRNLYNKNKIRKKADSASFLQLSGRILNIEPSCWHSR